MQTILHHQNISYLSKDIFVIDGVTSEYSGSTQQKKAMDLIRGKRCRIKKIFYPSEIHQNMSPSCSISVGWKDIVIVASSQTLDERGRYIPYEYYSASYEEPILLLESLKRDVVLAGLEINEADLKAIEWTLNGLQNEKKIILGTLCACIALPIIIEIFN